MAQILEFDEAAGRVAPLERRADLQIVWREQVDEEPDDFWPEVSRGRWADQPIPVNPANSQGRVLTEMLVILGGAGLLVLLTTVFFGMPSP